jgi:vacuolar-type H+-ATPase subunit F/Vma7
VSRAAAIGEELWVGGYALAGVEVHAAVGTDAVHAAWESLADDVACLVLTAAALEALGGRLRERPHLVWAVIPA